MARHVAGVSIAAKHAHIIDGHKRPGVAASDYCAIIRSWLCGSRQSKVVSAAMQRLIATETEQIREVRLAVKDAKPGAKGPDVAAWLAKSPPSTIRWTKYVLQAAASGQADLRRLARA